MKALMQPVLDECDHLFKKWYEDLHGKGAVQHLVRLQSFVTRYRPHPNENALLRHIDGAQVRYVVLPFEYVGWLLLHVLFYRWMVLLLWPYQQIFLLLEAGLLYGKAHTTMRRNTFMTWLLAIYASLIILSSTKV